MKLKLTIKKKMAIIDEKTIESFPCSIGRDETNDIILDAPHISRFHAELQYGDHQWMLIRKSNTGKILFDGTQVDKQVLDPPASFEIPPYSLSLEPILGKKEPVEISESFQSTKVLKTSSQKVEF